LSAFPSFNRYFVLSEETTFMAVKRTEAVKPHRTFDGAYGFSFSIALGLVLFIGGLVVSLTLGGDSSLGLVFGVPLLIAGLLVPLFMVRGVFARNDIDEPCPACGSDIHTTDATMRLDCPKCGKTLRVQDMHLYAEKKG
jgi:ribosomal protein S27AE